MKNERLICPMCAGEVKEDKDGFITHYCYGGVMFSGDRESWDIFHKNSLLYTPLTMLAIKLITRFNKLLDRK